MRLGLALFAALAALSVACPAIAQRPLAIPAPVITPPVAPAPVSLERAPACEPQWATRVYRQTRASVVRIDNADGLGTGFVVFTPMYVATAFHVVALGRPLTITAADGSTQGARVVATDPKHDLAILELEHPIPGGAPLAAEPTPSPVGTPVLVIGHPFGLAERVNRTLDGLLYWTATQGIVSERNEEFVQTDAAVNPGNSGGPMLDCEGHVVGVVTAKLGGEAIGFAVPTARVNALLAHIGRERPYTGRWTGLGEAGLVGQFDRGYTWLGIELGFGFLAYDRFATELRGGLAWAVTTPDVPQLPMTNPGSLISNTGFRVLGELDETYRALMFEKPFPAYFLVGAGVLGTIDRVSQTTLGTAPLTPGCKPITSLACNQIVGIPSHQTNKRLWPMVTAGFLVAGSLQVTYAFEINVDSVPDSEHRLLLAFPF